jgi:hypothetical protein
LNKNRWLKLRDKIQASPKNVRPAQLVALVVGAGFTEHPRTGSSHRTFAKPPCNAIIGIPFGKGPVPKPYVVAALEAIDDCGDETEE